MSKDGVNQEFATWLYDAMRQAGYTPEPDRREAGRTRFAEAAGISPATVTRALDNGRVPEPAILRKMANALGVVTLDAFLAAGYLLPDDVGEPNLDGEATRPQLALVDVSAAIQHDPDLVDEARQHLLNQYDILRRFSSGLSSSKGTERPLRAVARKRQPRAPQQ